MQDGIPPEQDEESEREVGLLQIELETLKATGQIQMLQQVWHLSVIPLFSVQQELPGKNCRSLT